MSTYAIGDVQGCYDELQRLLDKIKFDPAQDVLWFTGDLVNRGPQSLEVLRFVSRLPNVISVLGNHDFTLLALAYTDQIIGHHNMSEILIANDRDSLLAWLLQRPLIHHDKSTGYVMVHAGIPPQWSLALSEQYAKEVEACLQGEEFAQLLNNIFGNEPKHWDERLEKWNRLRFIINALTRIRYCHEDGSLELKYKGKVTGAPSHLIPWYKFPIEDIGDRKILFGHWASLEGRVDHDHVIPLDTGCVWGNALTACRLEDGVFFKVGCNKH